MHPGGRRSIWLPELGVQATVTYQVSTDDASPEELLEGVEVDVQLRRGPVVYAARYRGSSDGPKLIAATTSIQTTNRDERGMEVTPEMHRQFDFRTLQRGVGAALQENLQGWLQEHIQVVTPARGDRHPERHYGYVANAFRYARAIGEAPAKYIAGTWGVSEPTANRWIGKARELNLLAPAPPQHGGRPKRIDKLPDPA